MANDITKRLSDCQAAAVNDHWTKWDEFYQDVALEPQIFSYRYPVPILNTFVSKYRKGTLAPSVHQVKSHSVEDSARLIYQALFTTGFPDPRLTGQGELGIWIQL